MTSVESYANPGRGNFTLLLHTTITTLQLQDALGRVVRRLVRPAESPPQLVLETGDLPPGVYTLQWVEQGQARAKRIVLE